MPIEYKINIETWKAFFIDDELEEEDQDTDVNSGAVPKLAWTSSKVSLIELMYGG